MRTIHRVTLIDPLLLANIRLFETDKLDEFGIVDLFNYLIVTKLVWKMGPGWTRQAVMLIENGWCSLPCDGRC